jgi:hypothetical protein
VYALCACPLAELLKAHRNPDYEFSVEAVTATGDHIPIAVGKQSPGQLSLQNCHLADRYFPGDKDLLY